jgi:uncharacterized protein
MNQNTRFIDINYAQLESLVDKLYTDIVASGWTPDYVAGISRGGLIPAVMLSHRLGCPLNTLKINLRDHSETESNLWMAEDAFGYVYAEPSVRQLESEKKQILIVDDINDTGATFNWIKTDWSSGCLPSSGAWNSVWHQNVKFAALVHNESSEFTNLDFHAMIINKADDPVWINFPWETWWKK